MTAAKKHIWKVGDIVGAVEIVKVFEGAVAYRDKVALGCCTIPGCGFTREMTHQALMAQKNGRRKACPVCRQRKSVGSWFRRRLRGCSVCSDCPALRPADGTPCACGESRQ